MAKTAVKIAVLCMLFAALSAIINIGSQMVLIWAYKAPFAVEVYILVGIAAGLVAAMPLRTKAMNVGESTSTGRVRPFLNERKA